MRFITMAACAGELSEEEVDARWDGYSAHFESIRGRLPHCLVWLNDTYGLHDGTLLVLSCDVEARLALMVVDAWNNFNGDFEVGYRLQFGGVVAVDLSAAALNDRSKEGGFGDLLYFEIHVLADGLYRMDLLFWSGMEVGVTFMTLSVTTDPADFYPAS